MFNIASPNFDSLRLTYVRSTQPSHGLTSLVVLAPHLKDAILSLGGMLLHRRGTLPLTIITVFCNQKHTRNGNKIESSETVDISINENAVLQTLGVAKYINLGFQSTFHKYFSAKNILEENPLSFEGIVIKTIRRELKRHNCDTPLLLCPAGFGGHINHLLTRTAASLFRSIYYPELPAAAMDTNHSEVRNFLSTRRLMVNEMCGISIERHLFACRKYLSDFSEEDGSNIKKYLENYGSRLWQ